MPTKTIFLTCTLLLSLSGCQKSTIDALERDKTNLQAKLTTCEAKLEDSEASVEDYKTRLKSSEFKAEDKLMRVCDSFEFQAKWALTPSGVTMTEGGGLLTSQCDPDLALSVRKINTEGAYLKYTVNGEVRYSDELVFEGKKSDRKAIFITEGLTNPVMVYVPGCHKDKCDVECLSLKTDHLTCTNPDITP